MYLILYNLSLLLFRTGIRIAALTNSKARLWWKGRENIFQNLEDVLDKNKKTIWFHCASLGEFEQGRPVIEKIRADYPGYTLLITFFSPSGYEVRKNYKGADHIFYLPLDSASNARRFLKIVNPVLVIFVKYEFWYYYFKNIRDRQIPFLLVSAVFRNNQPFFKWYGSLYRKMLDSFTWIFVQDSHSKELLNARSKQQNVTIAGDTRFDRVAEIARKFEPLPFIDEFCRGQKVIVAGSTWSDDEKALSQVFTSLEDRSLQLVIVPHETDKAHLFQLKNLFPSALFYSDLIANNSLDTEYSRILIVDTVGILSRLYHYAYITYVGGGFTRDGIHNILEAAVYGKPVVFGPIYHKYREAIELTEAGGAASFSTTAELQQMIEDLLQNKNDYDRKSVASREYVLRNEGATRKIVEFIQENRLLTN